MTRKLIKNYPKHGSFLTLILLYILIITLFLGVTLKYCGHIEKGRVLCA